MEQIFTEREQEPSFTATKSHLEQEISRIINHEIIVIPGISGISSPEPNPIPICTGTSRPPREAGRNKRNNEKVATFAVIASKSIPIPI